MLLEMVISCDIRISHSLAMPCLKTWQYYHCNHRRDSWYVDKHKHFMEVTATLADGFIPRIIDASQLSCWLIDNCDCRRVIHCPVCEKQSFQVDLVWERQMIYINIYKLVIVEMIELRNQGWNRTACNKPVPADAYLRFCHQSPRQSSGCALLLARGRGHCCAKLATS